MINRPSSERERFPARARLARLGRAGAWLSGALVLAGCSISMSLPSFIDKEPTGSIKPKPSPVSSAYDARDWRIAEPVLAASLRAPGRGGAVVWSNAETGDHGEFQAVDATFTRDGLSCRTFVARLAEANETRTLKAVGCPGESGEVAIYDASPWTGL
jgi:hypothetical protein